MWFCRDILCLSNDIYIIKFYCAPPENEFFTLRPLISTLKRRRMNLILIFR
jgi:hypothetical protein